MHNIDINQNYLTSPRKIKIKILIKHKIFFLFILVLHWQSAEKSTKNSWKSLRNPSRKTQNSFSQSDLIPTKSSTFQWSKTTNSSIAHRRPSQLTLSNVSVAPTTKVFCCIGSPVVSASGLYYLSVMPRTTAYRQSDALSIGWTVP